MSKIHSFQEELEFSHNQADAWWWEEVYRQAFPNYHTMIDVRNRGWVQQSGVDRYVILTNGKIIKIDEKVRRDHWPDIALEFYSSVQHRTPGWIRKDLDCDYIAYAFVPTATCYLFPFYALRKAWQDNVQQWWLLAQNESQGFKVVNAQNEGYTTQSLAVPTQRLLEAIKESMEIHWQ